MTGSTHHSHIRGMVDIVAPLLVYLALELFGASALIALVGGVAVLAARLGWLAKQHRLTCTTLVSSALFIVLAVVVSITGNRWLFLLKPVVTEALLGILMVTNGRRDEQPYSLAILCRLRPRRREQLLRQFHINPEARRRHRIVTTAWGVIVIIEGIVRIVALLTLPPWWVIITTMPLNVVTVVLGAFASLRYLSFPTGTARKTEPMDIIDAYRRVSEQTETLVEAIPEDRFGFATPCAEWDIKALCNHIYVGEIIVSTRILDQPQPDSKSAEDRLGDRPKEKIIAAIHQLRELLAQPDVLDRTVSTHRNGKTFARNLAGLLSRRTADLLVHNWDLAKALGRNTADFDPDLVAWTLAHYQERFDGYQRTAPQIIASVAEEKPAPDIATPADHLAAFMGRDVTFIPGVFSSDKG